MAWATGAAYGLWGIGVELDPIPVTWGPVGFAVTELVPAGQIPVAYEAADGPGGPAGGPEGLLLPLGSDQAAELLDAPGRAAAWTFDVVSAASGNAGVEYSIAVPEFDEGTIFESAEIVVFPVADASQCSVAEAPANGPSLSQIQGINPDYDELNPLKRRTDHWCVVAKAENLPMGHYENTVTVSGIATNGSTVTATDSWEAQVLPDPTDETEGIGLTVTHEVTKPQ
jgi:hypothetical protein